MVFYFDHLDFRIQYDYYSKNHQLLLVYNNFSFYYWKRFLISLITLSLISSFYFFSLKRFFVSPVTLFLIALFSFFSLKRFLISLLVASFGSFFSSKKISYIFLYDVIFYFFIYFFYLFQAWTFHPCILWKKLFSLKKQNSIIPLKKAFEYTIFKVIQLVFKQC